MLDSDAHVFGSLANLDDYILRDMLYATALNNYCNVAYYMFFFVFFTSECCFFSKENKLPIIQRMVALGLIKSYR